MILKLNQPVHNCVCFFKRKSIYKPYSFSQQNSDLFSFLFWLIVALPKCHLKYFAHSVIWSKSEKTNISLCYKIYKSKHWVRSTKKKMREKWRSREWCSWFINCSDNIGGGWCSATHNKEENKALQWVMRQLRCHCQISTLF